MTSMRSSMDRLVERGHSEPYWQLVLRAIRERRIAVIDLTKTKNGDFAFEQWAAKEAERQGLAMKKEQGG